MSKVTLDAAAELRLTVNDAVTVPLLPSVTVTSSTEIDGGPVQMFRAEEVLRGLGEPGEAGGVALAKSAAFWSVSKHPPPSLRTAFVLDGAGVGPEPSKQL